MHTHVSRPAQHTSTVTHSDGQASKGVQVCHERGGLVVLAVLIHTLPVHVLVEVWACDMHEVRITSYDEGKEGGTHHLRC